MGGARRSAGRRDGRLYSQVRGSRMPTRSRLILLQDGSVLVSGEAETATAGGPARGNGGGQRWNRSQGGRTARTAPGTGTRTARNTPATSNERPTRSGGWTK